MDLKAYWGYRYLFSLNYCFIHDKGNYKIGVQVFYSKYLTLRADHSPTRPAASSTSPSVPTITLALPKTLY